jgi:DHA2 family multidrug resistance protein
LPANELSTLHNRSLVIGNRFEAIDTTEHLKCNRSTAADSVGRATLKKRLACWTCIYIPKEARGAAVGLLALLRNEGGSVGTSVAQIIQERREQFHTLRLNENLDPLNPSVNTLLTRGQAFFLQHNGDAVLSHQMALGVLGQSRAQQASSLAYFDVFSFSAAVGVLLVAFVLLMRRSVAEKGAHIGGE